MSTVLNVPSVQAQNQGSYRGVLAIHGGAGTIERKDMTPEREQRVREAMTEALKAGYAVLKSGGTSLDAVVASVRVMEDSPLFNAGKGAVLTTTGEAELDASIMDGATLKAGAVASVKTVRNPITLARRVMDNSEHVFLAGRGAEIFAEQQGLEIVPNSYFITPERVRQLEQVRQQEAAQEKHGTVGAVALDEQGNLAAATSTGGMTNKKFGRVGDSPVIGAGTYADNETCAVSSTGHGEFFIRTVVAYDVAARMRYLHESLSEAADRVIHGRLETLGGTGGLIAIDRKGNITMPFNTPGMYRGFIDEAGNVTIEIYKD